MSELSMCKFVFLYWHSGEKNLSLLMEKNLNNIRDRLNETNWKVVLISLDESDINYAGNWIDLPDYIFHIREKRSEESGVMALQGDVIRMLLLYRYGGVYFDLSTILLKSEIENISLFKALTLDDDASIAGYKNTTFVNYCGKSFQFYDAVDGIELGALFAKKGSDFLFILLNEIEKYWGWKTKDVDYREYPGFISARLGEKSFLNEYHVHYSILHMVLFNDRNLSKHIKAQSIHMIGKLGAKTHGPYCMTDMFARGDGYGAACPDKLADVFVDGDLQNYSGQIISFKERLDILKNVDFLLIPGYLRVSIDKLLNNSGLREVNGLSACYKFF